MHSLLQEAQVRFALFRVRDLSTIIALKDCDFRGRENCDWPKKVKSNVYQAFIPPQVFVFFGFHLANIWGTVAYVANTQIGI